MRLFAIEAKVIKKWWWLGNGLLFEEHKTEEKVGRLRKWK